MGGAQCGTQFLTDPLRDYSNLSSFLFAWRYLRSTRLSIFYFLLHCLFFSLTLSILILFSIPFSVSSWLKANLSLTIRFLFHPFGSPAVVRLEFPAFASSSSPSSPGKWPLVFSWNECQFSLNGNYVCCSKIAHETDSSTNASLMSDLKSYMTQPVSPSNSIIHWISSPPLI